MTKKKLLNVSTETRRSFWAKLAEVMAPRDDIGPCRKEDIDRSRESDTYLPYGLHPDELDANGKPLIIYTRSMRHFGSV